MTSRTAASLCAMAVALRERGWTQGFRQRDGRLCLVEAALLVGGGEAAWTAIAAFVGEPPVRWNSKPGRTQDEVVGMLVECARMGDLDGKNRGA